MLISPEDRSELRALVQSLTMQQDEAYITVHRHNPWRWAEVNGELVVEFLTQYNEFLNHPIKPLRPFLEGNMKL